MDRERLTELLQDPSHVAKQDLAALRSMAEHFPWFSGAHLLLAVGEHETGDVLANDRHSTPAAFLPSRAVLFDLVRPEEPREAAPMHVVKRSVPFPAEPLPESPASSELAPSVPHPVEAALVPSIAPQVTIPDIPPIVAGTVSVEFEKEAKETGDAPTVGDANGKAGLEAPSVITPEIPLPAPATDPAPTAETPEAPKAASPEEELLDLQIHEAIRASGYDIGQFDRTVTAPPEPSHSPATESAAGSQEAPPSPGDATPPSEVEPTSPLFASPGTRLRFTDWLDQAEMPASVGVLSGTAPVRPPAPAIPRKDVTLPPAEPLPAGFSVLDLMEQFIQRSNPAPATAKASFFNPQQAAKRSLQDDGLVSETLARIHEKQGNFAKAKEVYDRLAVKHPEKSVYFAALSKALEGRMHK